VYNISLPKEQDTKKDGKSFDVVQATSFTPALKLNPAPIPNRLLIHVGH
jgi:hypothetical protein